MTMFEVVSPFNRLLHLFSTLSRNRLPGFLSTGIFLCMTISINAAAPCTNGTVTNASGDPIEGATVSYENENREALTDATGNYQFNCSSVRHDLKRIGTVQPVIRNGKLSFSIDACATFVRCDIFSVNGQKVCTVAHGIHQPGEYAYDPGPGELSAGTYLLSLNIGNSQQVMRIILSGNGQHILANTRVPVAESAVPKTTAALSEEETVDNIVCNATGYKRQSKPVSSYTEVVDFVMEEEDTIPPVITFDEGTDTVQVHYSDLAAFESWFDEDNYQITITDNEDPDPTLRPPMQTIFDLTKPGFLDMRFTAFDASENEAYYIRLLVLYDSTVTDDTDPPDIVFSYDVDTLHLTKGSLFAPDTGVTALDAVDTMVDLTSRIAISDDIETTRERTGFVTVDVPGTYTITYRVIDTSLNLGERKRTIIVEE